LNIESTGDKMPFEVGGNHIFPFKSGYKWCYLDCDRTANPGT